MPDRDRFGVPVPFALALAEGLRSGPRGRLDDRRLALVPGIEDVEIVRALAIEAGAGDERAPVERFGGELGSAGQGGAGGADRGQGRVGAGDLLLGDVVAVPGGSFPGEVAGEAQGGGGAEDEPPRGGERLAEAQLGVDGELAAGRHDVVGVVGQAERELQVGGVPVGGGRREREAQRREQPQQRAEREQSPRELQPGVPTKASESSAHERPSESLPGDAFPPDYQTHRLIKAPPPHFLSPTRRAPPALRPRAKEIRHTRACRGYLAEFCTGSRAVSLRVGWGGGNGA